MIGREVMEEKRGAGFCLGGFWDMWMDGKRNCGNGMGEEVDI